MPSQQPVNARVELIIKHAHLEVLELEFGNQYVNIFKQNHVYVLTIKLLTQHSVLISILARMDIYIIETVECMIC